MNNIYKILETLDSLLPQTVTETPRYIDPELQKIVHNYPREVKLLLNNGDIDKDLYSALFDYYFNSGEMPYGTAKARDGDPYEWIAQRFADDVGDDIPLSSAGLGLANTMKSVENEMSEGNIEHTATGLTHRGSYGTEYKTSGREFGKQKDAMDMDSLNKDLTSRLDKSMGIGEPDFDDEIDEEIRTYGAIGGAGSMGGVTESSANLYRKWSNIVEGKQSKPDFLDLDNDGDKKEPMKKAAKDKQVDEAAKPDFLDVDKDGNKKETFKKAVKDKQVKEAAADEPAEPDSDAIAKKKAREAARRRREEKAEADKDDLSKDYRPSGGKSASSKFVAGRAYGGAAQKDEPEDDDSDSKPSAGAAKKRGRPAGTKRAIGAKGPTGKSKLLKKGAIKEGNNNNPLVKAVVDRMESWLDHLGFKGWSDVEADDIEYALTSNPRDQHGKEIWAKIEDMPMRDYRKFVNDVQDACAARGDIDEATNTVAEKAPPGAKAERMVKHIKKSLSKDGHLSDKDKAIAYATTWKAHKAGKVEEAEVEEGSTGDYSAKKARAGKDIGKPGKNFEKIAKSAGKKYGSKERGEKVAGAVLAKLRGKNESKDEQVDETTVAGAVATSTAAPKGGSKGGYQFGKGVYESINSQVEKMIVEGMSINVNVDSNGQKSINVSATDEDADKLAEILKMAGIAGGQVGGVEEARVCETCGSAQCECAVMGESEELANSPDEEYADTDMMTNKLAGGLNKPKTTVAGDGQTTIPVTAVQVKESQEVTKIENSLWNLFKSFKK